MSIGLLQKLEGDVGVDVAKDLLDADLQAEIDVVERRMRGNRLVYVQLRVGLLHKPHVGNGFHRVMMPIDL